jgi:hypothetical protein
MASKVEITESGTVIYGIVSIGRLTPYSTKLDSFTFRSNMPSSIPDMESNDYEKLKADVIQRIESIANKSK